MFGYEIGPPPARLTGASVLARVVEGLAFRYYWATEGMRTEDYDFRPGPESMSALELQKHILNLVHMIQQTAFDADERKRFRSDDPAVLRHRTLAALGRVHARLLDTDDEALSTHTVLKRDGSRFPVWNIMNGPLSDALTHVGQINAWRRLNGNPTEPVNVFAGVPPARE